MFNPRPPFSNLIGRGAVDLVSDIVVVRQLFQAQELMVVPAGPVQLTWGDHHPAVTPGILPCLVLVHHHQAATVAEKLELFGAHFAGPLFIGRIKIATVCAERLSLCPVAVVRRPIADPFPGLISLLVQSDPASVL